MPLVLVPNDGGGWGGESLYILQLSTRGNQKRVQRETHRGLCGSINLNYYQSQIQGYYILMWMDKNNKRDGKLKRTKI